MTSLFILKHFRSSISYIFFLLLIILTVSGCTLKKDNQNNYHSSSDDIANTDFGSTILSLLTPENPSGELNEKDIQEAFSYFCKQVFIREISSDSISLHYTLSNPKDFGISGISPSFGETEIEQEEIISAENYLYLLSQFPYDDLTKKQKLTYKIFKNSLEDSIALAEYPLYAEPLSKTIGTQAQLPILLSEYTFYQESDVDDYLTLLTHLPAYFEQLGEFERQKAEAGLFMQEENALAILNQCEEMILLEKKKDNHNFLITSFEERLTKLSSTCKFSDEQKALWIKENKRILKEFFTPAYKNLSLVFKELLKSGKNSCGLSYFPEGKEYYKRLVKHNTGSNRSIVELKKLINDRILTCAKEISSVIQNNSKEQLNQSDSLEEPNKEFSDSTNDILDSALLESDNYSLPFPDADHILSYLKTQLSTSFPMASHTCNVFSVPESLTEYLSPAFYLTPPIDRKTENCIYINKPQIHDDLSFFTTLAHEGYPGHLYQNAMFSATNPDILRYLLSYPGYSEGWASYAELYSYHLSGLSDTTAILQEKNALLTLCMYAMADIHIHYDGYTEGGINDYLKSFGITNEESIHAIYLQILAEPANYLKYTIGCLEFLSLKEEMQKELGDSFDLLKFHNAVLSIGPCEFTLLKEEVQKELQL